jgi:hypothetical protein
MTNETYLIVSYFVAGLVCLALALIAYLWLRRPVNGIADMLPNRNWGRLLRKCFPFTTILFAFSTFLSVDYYGGCGKKPYKEIIENRSYLVDKNKEQVSQTLAAITLVVFLWGIIVLLGLVSVSRALTAREPEPSDGEQPNASPR